MIIGITGLIGSGKGAVSEILVGRGFIKLGLSDSINEELVEKGIEVTRENQVKYANEMRSKEGLSYFAKKLIKRIKYEKDYVVEGFRNVAEVEEFRKLNDFILVGVAAGFIRRFNWIIERRRSGDPKTLEEFKKIEKIDFLQNETYGQQNALCFSMADYYIANEGNYEDLVNKIEEMLGRYLSE